MQYRSRPKIISEILATARSSTFEGGVTITSLMRKCNLSYSGMSSLLSQLVGAGLLKTIQEDRSVRYLLSERGSSYLRLFSEFESFVDSYGLKL